MSLFLLKEIYKINYLRNIILIKVIFLSGVAIPFIGYIFKDWNSVTQ